MSIKAFLTTMLGALVIAAVVAGLALADESEWEVNEETLSELSLEEEEVTVSDKPISLVVPGLEIKIECKKSKGGGGILKGGSIELAVELTSCEIPKASSCKVSEPLKIETEAELTYAGGVYYDEFGAAEGKGSLATVVLSGEGCGLPKESKLSGSFAAAISLEEAEELPEKFSEATTTTVNKELKKESEPELKLSFGEGTAYIEGEFVLVPPVPEEVQRIPHTQLCTMQARLCPPNKVLKEGDSVDGANSGAAVFKFEGEEITCNRSDFRINLGPPSVGPVSGALLEFSAEECGAECTIEPTASGGEFVTSGGPGNGKMTLVSLNLQLDCEEEHCLYRRALMRFTATGGTPATFKAAPGVSLDKRQDSDEECADVATWYGPLGGGMTYTSLMPNTLYVTG